MEERIGYVYLLRNLVNGKGYVGQTSRVAVEKRWTQRINAAKGGFATYALHRAICKYGADNFRIFTLWSGPVRQLNAMETAFIAEYNTFVDDHRGYNMTRGGNAAGCIAVQALRKLSKAAKLQWSDPEKRKAMCAGISAAGLKRFAQPEELAKRSLNGKAVWERASYRKSQKLAVASKSAALTMYNNKRWADPAYKAAHSKASEATRLKMSTAQKARWTERRERKLASA